jgi:NADPH:quinone reductase-like Zn-dependent oxidoreductase
MKTIVQDEYGSPEVLELKDIDNPEIGDDEVLVQVHAAGVNPGDWAITSGLPYIARPYTDCASQRTQSEEPTWRGRSKRSAPA